MDILRVCDALLLHHSKFKDSILIAFQNKFNPLWLHIFSQTKCKHISAVLQHLNCPFVTELNASLLPVIKSDFQW